ncbi:MAG: hypothetical protein G3I09_06945 [Ferrovum sp.]|nr:hypothetical protein [Ferrovum sp.]
MISLRQIFFASTAALYLGISYLASTATQPPALAILVGLAPFGITALVASWKAKAKFPLLLLCAVCILTLALNLENLRNHVAWLYFIQHAGTMIFLGITFGSTLGNGHASALCSRIASFIMPKTLGPEYLFYTWKVTLAWTIYFWICAATSIVLFFFSSIDIWSVFADLVTPLTLGAMFLGEHFIRTHCMPDAPHISILAIIHAYREYSRRQDLP